ncbi:hypothetical protein, partial [Desulfobacula sp.]|uniref:hypothetical protein n=1 Tax=Desulfobacula sp. TaxID=2593537 RepID=UPI0039B87E56
MISLVNARKPFSSLSESMVLNPQGLIPKSLPADHNLSHKKIDFSFGMLWWTTAKLWNGVVYVYKSNYAIEYKKATLALCEVLSFLKVKFAVYAFSTENRSVVCWSIKSDNIKWNNVTAKRLAQIVANGSTPLAEVYDKMFPILQSKRPDIFLTLT